MGILSLESVEMKSNYVLVMPTRANDEYKMADGNVLYIDTTYEKEQHAVTSGIVFKVPEKLQFNLEGNKLDFDVSMDLKEGDEVFHHYLASKHCIEYGKYVIYEGILMLMVNYDQLYAAKRQIEETNEFDVVMLNGYVLIEPEIEEKPEVNIKGYTLPEYLFNRASGQFGTVKYIGSPVKEYRDPDYRDFDDSKVDISPGDRIFFIQNNDIPLEYEIHRSFEGKQEFFRMQRRDILAKVN